MQDFTASFDANGVREVNFSALCNPTPRQREFFKAMDEHTFTLYGGARGGGKSYILRWAAIRFLLRAFAKGFTGVRVGIFCETFPALKDRQLERARNGRPEDRYPDWLGEWHISDKEFRLYPQYGGGVVCFRNLDDPSKYRSAEFAAVFVDELTRNPITVFNDLRASRRWPGLDHTPFVAATNPTGIGHPWVKDIWIDATFDTDETRNLIAVNPRTNRSPYRREDFAYVKALPTDNPHNSDEYLAELESLPDRLRAAFYEGNWDVFEGQAFDEFSREVHVVPNGMQHLKDWYWVAGLDWGYRKGWIGLCAIGPEGQVEVVSEVYFSRLHAYTAARAIFKRWEMFPVPTTIYYDGQMDSDTGVRGSMTLRTEFERGMFKHFGSYDRMPKMIPGAKGPGSRKVKFDTMHAYLDWKDIRDPATGRLVPWARPLLTMQQRCKHLIRTLPSLPVDPDRPEDDVDTSAEDHPYDGLGFVLLAQPPRPDREGGDRDPDQHPGLDRRGRRKREPEPEEVLVGKSSSDRSAGYQMPREDEYEAVEDF